MLLVHRPEGLYCEAGDFFVDPWRPVRRAVITHAHADHARPGHAAYLAAAPAEGVLRARLGAGIALRTLEYGETIESNGARVSLHPAGHVLGSAQVRIEHRGEVWVVSGDYKVEPDPTCVPFEPVRCHTFVTESTFGLPIYRWAPSAEVFAGVNAWWRANADAGRASVLYCYAFGKAQRILAGVDASIGPIVCHGAIEPLNRAYRAAGVALPPTRLVSEVKDRAELGRALVLAPPSAGGTTWIRRFPDPSDAFASGWMAVRGARRRRAVDRGFVLSDHADWPGLHAAVGASGAQRIFVTHGYVPVMMRWLAEQGLDAQSFETEFGGEEGAAIDDAGAAAAPGAATDGEAADVAGPAGPRADDPDGRA
ncbi:MAG: ligase-associated DNA damage response exonuclease [Burkholderiaceae bacterium]|nr:ligase-associated DNA damage response exonuclease [Burkholderiales bacterium]MCZ8104603.1 ligase-associated DNA damage response exonuclease [Burkholderiales bacterium]MCZ8339767.1 ligase-associated DNA damage response exonuclease [Burkholderiaceae bacterium]